jgi:hypothetical protein
VAKGPVGEVVTDAHLTRAFGAPCEVKKEPSRRYSLRFRGP